MRRTIFKWFIQAAIVGIGFEVGKDIYQWLKGRRRRDEAAPPAQTPSAPEQQAPPSPPTSG
jgi:hypothetical protein